MRHNVGLTFTFLLIIGLLSVYVFLELFVAISLNTWFWLGSAVVLTLLPLGLGFALRSRALRVASPVLTVLVLSSRLIALNPAKPFWAFYRALTPGMQVGQVHALLAKHFPTGGRFRVPVEHLSASQLSYVLDPTNGNYNSEFVVIKLGPQGVVSAAYLPD